MDRTSRQPPRRPDGAAPLPDTVALSSVLIALFDGLALQWLLDPDHALTAEDALRGLEVLGAAVVPTVDE